MKRVKKYAVSLVITILFFSISILTINYFSNRKSDVKANSLDEVTIRKDAEAKKHAETLKVIADKNKNFVRPAVDNKALSDALLLPTWTNIGIRKMDPSIQLPMSYSTQKLYSITYVAYAPYDLLIGATYTNDSTKGIIKDLKSDITTGANVIKDIDFPGSGTITFTKLDGDSLYFTTASGKSGVFNIKNSRYNFK